MIVGESTLSDNALTRLTSALTDPAAKSIVDQALPQVKVMIAQERNRLAEALLSGIPFAAGAAILASATYYLVPEGKRSLKALGYGGAAFTLGGSAIAILANLGSAETEAKARAQASTGLDPYIQNASQALVAKAEPRVREIIQEERARLSQALSAGLPWAVGAALVALASLFLVPSSMSTMKFLGLSGSTALFALGARATLSGMES